MAIKVLVCGGRQYYDKNVVYGELDKLHALAEIHCIVQGGATGADQLGKIWAKKNGVHPVTYEPLWEVNDRKAGNMRNEFMLSDSKPDIVLAFPGGTGTKDMITRAEKAGYEVRRVGF